jgi:2-dehydro-3-deoxyphosphogluconate aldolase/4-hydroxy-2-oxoglutarate aldolase
MNEVLKKIQKIGILPVVVLEDAKDAKPLANALCEGGLPLAEVTFRTSAAKESIEIMSSQFPDMLVGAGTVLSVEQVNEAIKAGAKFIVSPGFDDEVVNYCLENNIPVTPGTCTPSDVQKCYKLGLEVVKFFPAEPSGGLNMIKAIAAPYTTIKFIPTGGIDLNNMSNYLSYEKIFAIGGSWMVKGSLVKNGEFDKIKQMTKEAVERVKEVRK